VEARADGHGRRSGLRRCNQRAPATAAPLYARGPDSGKDSGERRDLARARPVEAGFLRSLVRARGLLPGVLTPAAGQLDDETREQLRALGYLR
jgi:hypothetical protein